MAVSLPKVYENYASQAVNALKHGYASKDSYTEIDDQASELSDEQQYEFFRRIRDGLTESLAEHSTICQNPGSCMESLGSEKGINSMNKRMDALKPYLEPAYFAESIDETVNHPTEHTTARQVLAMKFLLDYAKIRIHNDKSASRFLHFLTGKSAENLYKLWRQPYNKDVLSKEVEDLRYIRAFFEGLGANEIVKMINNEIDNIENKRVG